MIYVKENSKITPLVKDAETDTTTNVKIFTHVLNDVSLTSENDYHYQRTICYDDLINLTGYTLIAVNPQFLSFEVVVYAYYDNNESIVVDIFRRDNSIVPSYVPSSARLELVYVRS